jgi:hypothetical protein
MYQSVTTEVLATFSANWLQTGDESKHHLEGSDDSEMAG